MKDEGFGRVRRALKTLAVYYCRCYLPQQEERECQ